MSAKNTATVVIGGKVTRLAGYESEEYLQRIASYLNHKNSELEEMKGWKRMTSDMKAKLLALNIADDYFKAKHQAELLDEDLQNKDREIYDLKQQIVELSMTLDDLTSPTGESRTGKR